MQLLGNLTVRKAVDAAQAENACGLRRQVVAQRQHLFDEQRGQRRVVGSVEKISHGKRLPRPGLLQLAQVDAVVKYFILPQPVQAFVVSH